jgi:hypothetical protein
LGCWVACTSGLGARAGRARRDVQGSTRARAGVRAHAARVRGRRWRCKQGWCVRNGCSVGASFIGPMPISSWMTQKRRMSQKNRYTIGNNLIFLNLFLHFYMFSVLELMTSQEQIYRCISLCFRLRNRKDRKKNEGVICRFV